MSYSRPKQRISAVKPVPAPVGGIDDNSSLAAMDPSYAVDMENFFPEASALRVRFGYKEWITGMAGGNGKTFMSYRATDGSYELFCCTDGGIYDVTASTATPAIVKAITNGRVNWCMFTNAAGNFLVGCNGTDAAFLYNGTIWIDFVVSGAPVNPGEISGALPTDFINVTAHKNRLWFITKNSMSAAYLPLDAVAGAVTAFPMGGVFTAGGRLSDLFTWTMGMGEDIEDVLVFQTTQGQLAGYRGYDPTSSSNWLLDSIYSIGRPLTDRTNVPLSGDMMMLTEHGLVSLSSVVTGQYRVGASESTASGRISRSLNAIVANLSSAPNWEVTSSPFHQYIIVNIPTTANYPGKQFVMNSVTGAWTRFNLPDVLTFIEHDGALYFSDTNNRVLVYGQTTVDNVPLGGTSGNNVMAGFQQAFNYFDSPGFQKHFKMISPIFESGNFPGYRAGVVTDYNPNGLSTVGQAPAPTGGISIWDVSDWDDGVWSPPNTAWQEWYGVAATGYAASLVLKTNTSIDTRYVATNWVYEEGAGL